LGLRTGPGLRTLDEPLKPYTRNSRHNGIVFGTFHALVLTAASAAAAASPQQGRPAAAPAQAPRSQAALELPVDMEKIQEALSRPQALRTTSDRPVFRVEVFAPKPTIETILGPDYLKGPVPYGGMTHAEFLNMVTPVEYRGYSMFTNKEGIAIAATSLALQWALMKAVDKFREAQNERAKEAARREVIEAMNELEAARKKAGLPAR
jgi:hypothetical protein